MRPSLLLVFILRCMSGTTGYSLAFTRDLARFGKRLGGPLLGEAMEGQIISRKSLVFGNVFTIRSRVSSTKVERVFINKPDLQSNGKNPLKYKVPCDQEPTERNRGKECRSRSTFPFRCLL